MARDDQRMHGGNTPGLVGGRGHERHEEPVRLNHPEPGEDSARPANGGHHPADDGSSVTDRDQPSALGGHVATRSGREPTPEDER